jgi:beta-glucosidase
MTGCLLVVAIHTQASAAGSPVQQRTEDGTLFRDLNKNGKLDPYEDARVPVEKRVQDLLSQMTLAEKVGLMFAPIVGLQPDGSVVEDESFYSQVGTPEAIARRHINHVGNFMPIAPEVLARWCNAVQRLAENTRLGIPITVYSDPRHGVDKAYTINNAFMPGWTHAPDPLGLAAMRDPVLLEQLASMIAREYRACGIQVALHPMADLATEPRWGRIAGTFGEDAELAATCVKAYVKGFQGATLGPTSVACMVKHFPGGGPQKEGWDCHYTYGKEQAYPGKRFDYHLIPFQAAIEAGVAQVMPYFAIGVGQTREPVGFGYSREIVTDLLRGKLGFQGVISSDGGIIAPYRSEGQELAYAKCWGVEELSIKQRFEKAIDAGLDLFLVECDTPIVMQLVKEGSVSQKRIDESVTRLLRDKFRLGLFDSPYVDPEKASQVCGSPEHQRIADLAQRKSIVLLKNGLTNGTHLLPLKRDTRIFVEGIRRDRAARYGRLVERVEDADAAIVQLNTPFEKRQGPLEALMHQGNLDFDSGTLRNIRKTLAAKPTVVCLYLERGAVMPEIAAEAGAVLATFGCSDDAILDVVFGEFKPTGKLPIELPRSMQAVKEQKEDVPCDSEDPLYAFGFGLTY